MTSDSIHLFHALYQSCTGQLSTLDPYREHCWFDWMRYREHQPFTEDDLKRVIEWVIKEFKAERRKSLAVLRFNILIGQPDTFEEMLNQITVEQRARTQKNPLSMLRKAEPQRLPVETGHSRHVSEIVKSSKFLELAAAMRKAIE